MGGGRILTVDMQQIERFYAAIAPIMLQKVVEYVENCCKYVSFRLVLFFCFNWFPFQHLSWRKREFFFEAFEKVVGIAKAYLEGDFRGVACCLLQQLIGAFQSDAAQEIAGTLPCQSFELTVQLATTHPDGLAQLLYAEAIVAHFYLYNLQ